MYRPHGNLDCKGCQEGQEDPELLILVQRKIVHAENAESAPFPVHVDQCDQHEYRTQECIQEELDGCVNTTRPAPDTNDQEHGNQRCFKEHIEQDGIQCREHTDHQPGHD